MRGRMSPAHLGGRAMAIVMIGIPLSLTIGIPAGTFLGGLIGWARGLSGDERHQHRC